MQTTPELAVVADDLSGAAECAAHGLLRVSRSVPLQLLSPTDATAARRAPDASGRVIVVDTDTRVLDGTAACERICAASELVASAPVVVHKVDSLLRGNVALEVAALAERLRRTPVVAVANPALGRTVTGGVLHVGDTPLHDTTLWALEPSAAPTSVADALRDLRTTPVSLDTVRSGVETLTDAFRRAAADGTAPVCDATDDADLDTVVAAARAAFGESLLVGSGALAAAAIRALPLNERAVHTGHDTSATLTPSPTSVARAPRVRSLLMVLGTRAGVVATQLDEVAPLARATLHVAPASLLADPGSVLRHLEALAPAGRAPDGLAVVALDPTAPADPAASEAIVAALADIVAAVADRFEGLFLAGGQTARAVLDRLGTASLEVVSALGPGTVASLRPDPNPHPEPDGSGVGTRVVVTRPGSFGEAGSLRHVAEQLLPPVAPDSPTPPSRTSATTKENR
ncbi:four-carbon acid sugar kinase family protein [Intrasporangium sp. YIM S08009]|uniref:four-carbon acid sugar kinase family protein n=1 Tax=Intrasporangium zincisolvens TaxID=3080018 RepID=UPI002B0529CE|nr:four-carbon acid sugar kinase family protein [Intrasporangium sp. YIM S08009]